LPPSSALAELASHVAATSNISLDVIIFDWKYFVSGLFAVSSVDARKQQTLGNNNEKTASSHLWNGKISKETD
jgi:hypothetical protein